MLKTHILCFLLIIVITSCSKKDDGIPSSKLNHVGQKWRIANLEYTKVDQGLSNPLDWVKTGTLTNAGFFYFNNGEGSFDIIIDTAREEDYFGYTTSGSTISIISIKQNLNGTRFSQSVIAISGDKTLTTMKVSGTVTRQSLGGQYVLTGDFDLVKE